MHFKRFIGGLVVLILAVPSLSVWQEDVGPRMEFEYQYSERTITENGNGLFVFPFQNTGDSPLIISIMKSSCGCLVPYYNREPVLPGQRDSVWGKYSTQRIGVINKSLTVTCNDPNSPIRLFIGGMVYPEEDSVRKKPNYYSRSSMRFSQREMHKNFFQDEQVRFDFDFRNTGDSILIIKGIKTYSDRLSVELPKSPIAPRQKGKVSIIYATPPEEPFEDSILIKTNGYWEKVKLTVRGQVFPKKTP